MEVLTDADQLHARAYALMLCPGLIPAVLESLALPALYKVTTT